MTLKRQQPKAGRKAPALFSFITLRRETFGGILFNPFLPLEMDLDEQETYITWMCDGTRSVDEILKKCQSLFNMGTDDAARKWDEIYAKLNKACAIHLVDMGSSETSSRATFLPLHGTQLFSMPKNVIWDVTYSCNLNCPHCLTDSGAKDRRELATKAAIRLIDILAEAKVLYLSLTGGEPFVRKDILELLAHIADTGMRVDIATNGFSVPDKIIEGLRNLPVYNIQVSVDGIKEKHDQFRGKKDAFARACKALRRFKDEGLSTSISTTATAQNIDQLGPLIDLALDLGCDSYKAIPFIPAGRGARNENQLRLSKQDVYVLTKTLFDKSREYAGRINIATETSFLFLLDPPDVTVDGYGKMICPAGYDQLNVGADGTVYPCPFLHDLPLGNLLTDPIDEIWHKSAILNDLRMLEKSTMKGSCSTCEYAPEYCRGGCRASAYLASGDIRSSDPLCFKDFQTNSLKSNNYVTLE